MILLFGASLALAQTPKIGWSLEDALKQINQQADDFKTALAQIEIISYNDDDEEIRQEKGIIYINEDGKIRYEEENNVRIILVLSNEVQIYYPDRLQVDIYPMSKYKNRLEPWARLGFSITGSKLKSNFIITSLGEKEIGESRTLGLELTPDKDSVREFVAKVLLWIDEASWMPKRQEISNNQADENLVITYTYMARNLKLNPDLFKDKWPKGTVKVKR